MLDLQRQSLSSSVRIHTAGVSGEWSYGADRNAHHPCYRMFNPVLSQAQAQLP